jgi:energy-coupling factor transporter ATP-binding protein EcfA2
MRTALPDFAKLTDPEVRFLYLKSIETHIIDAARAELERRGAPLVGEQRQQAAAQRTEKATAEAPKGEKPDTAGKRVARITAASDIEVKPVKWLQQLRIPLGELTLLGGREGIGKSTIAYTYAGQVTTGTMPGDLYGVPRDVIVIAAEDSWEHTIVPRLMAAGADLTKIHRLDVTIDDELPSQVSLPEDLEPMRDIVKRKDVALILLDPLTSRLNGKLDTHKDAEVRRALEPLVAFAKAADIAVLGIIHVNKGTHADPLQAIMGSRAFAAVARSILFCMRDPEADDDSCVLGHPKSNLGPKNTRTDRYTIVGKKVAETIEGEVWTGAVEWLGDAGRTVDEISAAVAEGGTDYLSATEEAAGWLQDYLETVGGPKASSIVKDAGRKAGHAERTLQRARKLLRLRVSSEGKPRQTIWELPEKSSRATFPPSGTTGTTGTTKEKKKIDNSPPPLVRASCANGANVPTLQELAPLEDGAR